MTDINYYVDLLKRNLPKYKKLKVNTLSESEAKEVVAKLLADGFGVELQSGNTFVLKSSSIPPVGVSDNTNKTTAKDNVSDKSSENEVAQPKQVTPPVDATGNTNKTAVTSMRVSIRLPAQVADALLSVYNEPNLSNAIRKAIKDALSAKGISVQFPAPVTTTTAKKSIPSIDEVFRND
ncbi:hypothetical protein [Deltalipothrixvirus pozzuoliense]|uniref:Uncharacterized protein ORF178 n=1 Tax=Acidianus filamentous virus 2 (isolate Italy/Pozzuoli) TaxID=654910 RepID=Y178_AFV2P|nr:hypothetical protein AFV2_gp10 [Acidianus filamentous virus 2]Q573F9.1 RecName: Full=Uncharacterized protein ORF178 [Acidianus filamentous virus 2 (isolate Pozzuoli)]CAH69397.1 hypothetical protein [Acidianus filamentous virus 2]